MVHGFYEWEYHGIPFSSLDEQGSLGTRFINYPRATNLWKS